MAAGSAGQVGGSVPAAATSSAGATLESRMAYQVNVERMVRDAQAQGVPADRARRAAVATQLLSASLAGGDIMREAADSGVTVAELLSAARAVGRNSRPSQPAPQGAASLPAQAPLSVPSEDPATASAVFSSAVPAPAAPSDVPGPQPQATTAASGRAAPAQAAPVAGRGLGAGLPTRRPPARAVPRTEPDRAVSAAPAPPRSQAMGGAV